MTAETGWLYFGRRFYDPEIGRWTTPDPLWFENGPLLFVDPDGLQLASALGFSIFLTILNLWPIIQILAVMGFEIRIRPAAWS